MMCFFKVSRHENEHWENRIKLPPSKSSSPPPREAGPCADGCEDPRLEGPPMLPGPVMMSDSRPMLRRSIAPASSPPPYVVAVWFVGCEGPEKQKSLPKFQSLKILLVSSTAHKIEDVMSANLQMRNLSTSNISRFSFWSLQFSWKTNFYFFSHQGLQ